MKRNTELFGPAGTPRVVVVGCGFGGIAAGVKMKRAGIHSFTIFEKSERVGGTWWDNQYPGAEVDVASHVYSFPFKRVRLVAHARQASRAAALPRGDRHRLGAVVAPAARRGRRPRGVGRDTHTYTLTLDNGETLECDVLIAATGFLNVPQYPTWPGLDDFERARSSTRRGGSTSTTSPARRSRWWAPVPRRRRSSPRSRRSWSRVYLFQREPGWVSPKGDHDYTTEQRAQLRQPALLLEDAAQGVPPTREGRVARRHLPAGSRRSTRCARPRAVSTSTASSPTYPELTQGGHAELPVSRASGRSSTPRSTAR